MAIEVGTNSWATIAEADAYFGSRPGSQAWFSLDDASAGDGGDSKEGFLVTAFYWLLDDSFSLSSSLTDDNVKRAQFEAAIFLLNFKEEYEDRQAKVAGGVTSFMLSRWTENLSVITKPQNIINILHNGGYSSSNVFVDLKGPDYSEYD